MGHSGRRSKTPALGGGFCLGAASHRLEVDAPAVDIAGIARGVVVHSELPDAIQEFCRQIQGDRLFDIVGTGAGAVVDVVERAIRSD